MNTALTTRPDLTETRRHKMRKWVLRIAIVLAVLGPLIFVFAAIGYRLGFVELGTSLGVLSRKAGPLVLVSGLIVSLIAMAMAFFMQPRKGLLIATIALLVSLGGLIKAKSIGAKVDRLPLIHDITTDTQNPPKFTQAIIDARASTNAPNDLKYIGKKDLRDEKLFSVLQAGAPEYSDIRPVILSEDPAIVFGEVLTLIKQAGWELVTEDVDAGILEATDTTFWYGFKDDIIVRIRPGEGGGSVVDMRSVSRVGASDIGKNAERLERLINGLK